MEISTNDDRRATSGEQLLIATGNAGKIREMEELLADLPLILRGLKEFPDVAEVEETGATFEENAVLKAGGYALQTGLWTVADDSGLEVEALDGAPGVFSARYAGENASDAEKIAKLLGEMKNATGRRARFVCSVAVADEKGSIKFLADGECAGRIALTASGTKGFGYDPIFVPDGYRETFGELSGDIKRQISHRARAMKKIIQYLRAFYGTGV